jgi:hypothetical protein
MEALGKTEVIRRLRRAIEYIGRMPNLKARTK